MLPEPAGSTLPSRLHRSEPFERVRANKNVRVRVLLFVTRMKRVIVPIALAAFACGGPVEESTPEVAVHEPSSDYDVQSAGLTAARSAELIGDVAEFVRDGLSLTGGRAGIGASGFLSFNASGQCTRSISFGGRQLSLEHDCTTPAGRRVRGSLSIDLNGGQCTSRGMEVEIHLSVESAPGMNDEIMLDGRVAFGMASRKLFFAVSIEHSRTWDVHSVERSIDGCFIVDGVEHVVAMNGHVRTTIDGAVLHNLEIRDLQHGLCRPMPHTGTVLAETMHGRVEIQFDGSSPDTSEVTVIAESGTSRVELEASTTLQFCDFGPTAPLPIDYSVCGDCGGQNPTPNPTPTVPPMGEDDPRDNLPPPGF